MRTLTSVRSLPLLALAIITCPAAATAQIRYNQLGYYPGATVHLTVADTTARQYRVLAADGGIAAAGALGPVTDWSALAGEYVRTASFATPTAEGAYRFEVPGVGTSAEFAVRPNLYADALAASVKSYYFQRAGLAIDEAHGGPWARAAGHPDTAVLFHATSGREGEGPYASPGGWYDAGDYNKYIVNAGFSVGMMLQLAEHYPAVLADGSIDFPEAGNGRGDLLDELKWELDWMLTMQDPSDGGVHHKLTTENFEEMVMPDAATRQRYILAKGTTATLDFAACMAIASRVYGRAGDEAYAAQLLDAARRAYAWAEAHPAVAFANPDGVNTGEYGDDDFADEWKWATVELFLATGDEEMLRFLINKRLDPRFVAGETWTASMSTLAVYSFLDQWPGRRSHATAPWDAMHRSLEGKVVDLADSLIARADSLAYRQPVRDWHWGSTSDVLGAAMATANAYRVTDDRKYLDATRAFADWVFGHNATGYSFVTGYGAQTPTDIHHRPSAADGVAEPVPGFIAGGPNTYQQDTSNNVTYPVPPGVAPMRSYADQEGSYASNEVCLNWNAPLTYVLGFLEANQ